MGMFGPKMGSWWVTCKSDPRWNNNGRAKGSVTAGGPTEMREWLEKCEKNFGDIPEDAQQGFMKD